jgi:hypothetical protein
LEWDLEWGHRIKVLLQYEKQTGKTPQALLDMPDLPWYYQEFVRHFRILSNNRVYRTFQAGDKMISTPNPIDITTILRYNEYIVKMANAADFIDIIMTLDGVFMTNSLKKTSK